jgi:hypothetical protein
MPLSQTNLKDRASKRNARKECNRLRRKIQHVKNQMDFIEILCNFWPMPNMSARHERLKAELGQISHHYQKALHGEVSDRAVSPSETAQAKPRPMPTSPHPAMAPTQEFDKSRPPAAPNLRHLQQPERESLPAWMSRYGFRRHLLSGTA